MRPRISVALATYNGEKFLCDLLQSVLSQTVKVDEIVISDDCSTDNTSSIIKGFQDNNADVEWIVIQNDSNLGFRKNFRQAINRCTGDYIFLCDQDDIWVPEKVEHCLSYLKNNDQIMALISDFKTIDSCGRFLQANQKTESLVVSDTIIDNTSVLNKIQLHHALYRTQGQGAATVITRELAELYRHTTINWAHDHLVDVIAALKGGLYYTKEQLFYYRIHGNNTIGMPVGGVNLHSLTLRENIRVFLSVMKYCLLLPSGEECRKHMFNPNLYLFKDIEEAVGCAESEKPALEKWRQFETERVHSIKSKKLIKYLGLLIKNPPYFREQVELCTFEQRTARIAYDLGAILKN